MISDWLGDWINWLDWLVFPIVILGAIIVKALLLTIGVDNSVIFMACLFLVLHLGLTGLMYMQIMSYQDSFISKIESAAFAAVVSSIVALLTYLTLSIFPFLKSLLFFIKWLPWNQIWGDLSVVAVPVFISHMIGRIVITGVLMD